jgi:tetratricopeptide (TPR) repeat protein
VEPKSRQAQYVLGLALRGLNRTEEAKAAFRAVLAVDPDDVGSRVNLGQLLLQDRAYDEAVAAFGAALAQEPHNGTALYNLGLAQTRAGRADEGQKTLESFRALRAAGYGTFVGQNYPDQGRYAEAVASSGAGSRSRGRRDALRPLRGRDSRGPREPPQARGRSRHDLRLRRRRRPGRLRRGPGRTGAAAESRRRASRR